MSPRSRRALLLLLPVVGSVAVGVATQRSVPVEARPVVAGRVAAEVLGVGTLESAHEAPVSFEVGGRVLELFADQGSVVTDGAPLGRLDVADAEHELALSRATEDAARAQVARARAELDRARARANRADAERARADALLPAGVLHRADHDAATEAARVAGAEVAAADAALLHAERSLAAAVAGRGLRADRVADGRLRSPFAGVVVSRAVEVGQLVAPGTPGFVVAGTDRLRAQVWVDETALGRLEVGQPAAITLHSEPDRAWPGRVERIGTEVDRRTHEVLVDVLLTEPPGRFALGQRVDAWITTAAVDAAAIVPPGWCAATCLVVEGGRAVARPVRLGLEGRDGVEVREGLAPGDAVLPPATPVGRRVTPALAAAGGGA